MTELAKVETHETALPADPMVSMIERIVLDPTADIAKLERMLELKKEHEADTARKAFNAAFAKASAEFPMIPKNGRGHNGKAYAELADILKLTRPVLSENGLALTFGIDVAETVRVTAELMHKDGHSKSVSIDLPRENSGSKNAVQAVGSSQTYGQRYTAQAVLGLSLGDDMEDDGAGASGDKITADQFMEIKAAIEAVGIDDSIVAKAEGVAMLEALPANRFKAVMDKLAQTKGTEK